MSKPRDYSMTFSGPGEREIHARGRYVRILETPSADVFFSLDGGSELKRGAGQQIADSDPDGFSRVRVRSTVAQTVLFTVSDTPQDDARSNVALSVSANVAGSTAVVPLATVTVPAGGKVKLADANPDRVELRIAIRSDQPGEVYLGDSTMTAGEGGVLEPGMVDYMATTAEVWAYNQGVAAVDVTVLDMESP